MSIDVTGAYVYFVIPIFGGIPISQTTVSSLIVTIILCTLFIVLGRGLTKRPGKCQVLVEKGVTMMTNLTASAMGAHNVHWTPFMGCLFLCSICGSYIGLTGFLRSATADLNCTAVWALMVSFIIWFNNIKNDGIGKFLKNYVNPMNLISDLAQPLSMSFRHFSNISVGIIISTIMYAALTLASTIIIELVASAGWLTGGALIVAGLLMLLLLALPAKKRKKKWLSKTVISGVTLVVGLFGLLQSLNILSDIPVFTYGIPAVMSLYFDFFSGFIQALVFTLLSMVYIGNSLPGPETGSEVSVSKSN
ncbi:MAG: F0F1 ATP synthase subunit A [Ruminococcaceae bacterium]|nr:F0F1 ATP synthase subunit A [Oscillospiraceae bacterium]